MKNSKFRLRLPKTGAVYAIVLFVIIYSIILKGGYLTLRNVMNVFHQSATLCILSISAFLVILTHQIDLSLGSITSLSGVVLGLLLTRGFPLPVAILGAVLSGLLIGVINGVVIGCLKVAPMLATLGMQAVLLGLGLVITSGSVISGFPDWYIAFGNSRAFGIIPYQLFLLIPIAVFMYLLYSRTRLGRQIYLVGTNAQVAEFSNISVKWTIIKVYMLSALMAFFASVVLSSRLASGRPDIATSYLMPAIGAAVVGGVSMQGGKGSILGCALGVILFMVISNGLLQFIPQNATFYESVVTGAMILGILSYRSWRDRK